MEDQYVIQELLEQKNFASLTSAQKEMVLKYLTEEEYTTRRNMMLQTKAFLGLGVNEMPANDAVLLRAKAMMASKNSGGMMYRLPLWQAVAACVIVALVVYALRPQQLKQVAVKSTESTPKAVYVKDTVVVEKEKPVIRYVDRIRYKEVIKEVSVGVPEGMVVLNSSEALTGEQIANMTNLNLAKDRFKEQLTKIGQSSNEQENLKQFLVVSN